MANFKQVPGYHIAALFIVSAINGHTSALNPTRHHYHRKTGFFYRANVLRSCSNGWRQDHAICSKLKQCLKEIFLCDLLIAVIAQEKGLPVQSQFIFNAQENFCKERVHDIGDQNTHNA